MWGDVKAKGEGDARKVSLRLGGVDGSCHPLLWPCSGSAVISAVNVTCTENCFIVTHKMSLSVGVHLCLKGF